MAPKKAATPSGEVEPAAPPQSQTNKNTVMDTPQGKKQKTEVVTAKIVGAYSLNKATGQRTGARLQLEVTGFGNNKVRFRAAPRCASFFLRRPLLTARRRAAALPAPFTSALHVAFDPHDRRSKRSRPSASRPRRG